MKDKICDNCNTPMSSHEVPSDKILFTTPFTKIEIVVRNWNEKAYYCMDCFNDQQNERGREIYNAGVQDGYERAVNN